MPTQKKVDMEITLSNHVYLHARSYQEHSSFWNGCGTILPGTVLMKSASHLLHSWLPMYSLLCSNRHHLPLWIVCLNSLIWSSFCIQEAGCFQMSQKILNLSSPVSADTLVKQVPLAPYSSCPLRGVTETADERRDCHWIQVHSCTLCQAMSGAS